MRRWHAHGHESPLFPSPPFGGEGVGEGDFRSNAIEDTW